jgi:hypothetical protein
VSIYEQDHDHQYMYTSTKGFHFQDSEGILSDIIDVKVMDTQFAPFGFDPSLIRLTLCPSNELFANANGEMTKPVSNIADFANLSINLCTFIFSFIN